MTSQSSVSINSENDIIIDNILCPLNEEQQAACHIIDHHLITILCGKDQEQLLMLLMGSAGTGKTVTINAMHAIFKA
jgi:predicted GTPase